MNSGASSSSTPAPSVAAQPALPLGNGPDLLGFNVGQLSQEINGLLTAFGGAQPAGGVVPGAGIIQVQAGAGAPTMHIVTGGNGAIPGDLAAHIQHVQQIHQQAHAAAMQRMAQGPVPGGAAQVPQGQVQVQVHVQPHGILRTATAPAAPAPIPPAGGAAGAHPGTGRHGTRRNRSFDPPEGMNLVGVNQVTVLLFFVMIKEKKKKRKIARREKKKSWERKAGEEKRMYGVMITKWSNDLGVVE